MMEQTVVDVITPTVTSVTLTLQKEFQSKLMVYVNVIVEEIGTLRGHILRGLD